MRIKHVLAAIAMCVCLVAVSMAQPGSWKRVGKAGDWVNTIAGTGMGGKIYTVETSGKLYETDPNSGTWQPIGKADFVNTKFMLNAGDNLYTIERSGSLYKVNIR